MTDPQDAATDPADILGPGDPNAVDPKQPYPRPRYGEEHPRGTADAGGRHLG